MKALGPCLQIIGTVHSPHRTPEHMPIEPRGAGAGWVELDEQYRPGLADLDGFGRIWLIFLCHMSREPQLIVRPFLDNCTHGVFATRAPSRPSPIGISAVELVGMDAKNGRLDLFGVDIVDGSPLLDIKPYVPRFDAYPDARSGWLETAEETHVLSDARFFAPSPQNR